MFLLSFIFQCEFEFKVLRSISCHSFVHLSIVRHASFLSPRPHSPSLSLAPVLSNYFLVSLLPPTVLLYSAPVTSYLYLASVGLMPFGTGKMGPVSGGAPTTGSRASGRGGMLSCVPSESFSWEKGHFDFDVDCGTFGANSTHPTSHMSALQFPIFKCKLIITKR